jgi:predicted RNA-binding protein YlxR (DUF448 family)
VIGARSRSGDEARPHEGPLRLCAVSRIAKPTEELIRFVAAPDGTIVPDLAQRLPGRGVWVDATAATVAAAVRQNAFARSLKRQISAPADLPADVERLLVRRLAGAVAMANKAGLLVAGYVRVEARLRAGRVFLLLHAADAAATGTERLDRIFKGLHGSPDIAGLIIRELTSAELSLAIGQPTVVHAAAAEGGASQGLLREARRLRRYRLGAAPERSPASATRAKKGRVGPVTGAGTGLGMAGVAGALGDTVAGEGGCPMTSAGNRPGGAPDGTRDGTRDAGRDTDLDTGLDTGKA